MKVLIVGCGRVGATLAEILDAGSHEVTVIDIDQAAFGHLPPDFAGTTFLGNGNDLDVLRQNGVDKVDALIALTEGDNRNLMAAQIARELFGVKRVIAKVNDPLRAEIYRAKGITTISRTTILAMLIEATLMGRSEVGEVLIQRSTELEKRMVGQERREARAKAVAGSA